MSFQSVASSLLFLLCLSAASIPARAQEMPFLGGDQGNPFSFFFDDTHFMDASGPGNQRVHLNEQRFGMNIPISTDEKTFWNALLRGQRIYIDEKLVIADRGFVIPGEFGSVEAGLGWGEKRSEQHRVGASATLGSSGRTLLSKQNAVEVSFNAFTEHKQDDGNAWIYFLNYSNNRVILNNVPLPGFAYVMKKETTTMVMGVPFFFVFVNSMPWLLNATLSPFYTGAETTYIMGWPQIFAGVGWTPRAYQNLVKDDAEDRLIYEKKEASLGLRLPFGRQKNVSLAYVHSFNRQFYLGESPLKSNSERVVLGDAGGLQLKMKFAF